MPENWQPSEAGLAYAADLGFAEDRIAEMVRACVNYHLRKGTLIAGDVGLAATWRTWCDNEVKFSRDRQQRNGSGKNGRVTFSDVASGRVEL